MFTASCGTNYDNGVEMRAVEFVWKGNWNDPEHPDYKDGGYNPIEGLWENDIDNARIWYTENFLVKPGKHTGSGWIYETDSEIVYEINDTGYKYHDADGVLNMYEFYLTEEDNKIYMYRRRIWNEEDRVYDHWIKRVRLY